MAFYCHMVIYCQTPVVSIGCCQFPADTLGIVCMASFDDALNAAGGRRELTDVRRRREPLQEWRQVGAAWLHDATGSDSRTDWQGLALL